MNRKETATPKKKPRSSGGPIARQITPEFSRKNKIRSSGQAARAADFFVLPCAKNLFMGKNDDNNSSSSFSPRLPDERANARRERFFLPTWRIN